MSKKRCFISYDYDNDANIKNALMAQSKVENSPFEISDWSLKEASPNWEKEAREKIKNSSIVIVLCGENTHRAKGVEKELKIAQQENISYFLLAGYSDKPIRKPISAKDTDKIYTWNWDNLERLINNER